MGEAEVGNSGRAPLLLLFVSAAIWLCVSSLLALIAGLTFHAPDLFAHCPWLSYGRARAAATDIFMYGFAIQAGLGVMLWLFSRIGRTPLAHGLIALTGGEIWNLGVTLGLVGILIGDQTGFELMQIPHYAAAILFIAYLLIGISAAVTLRQRVAGTFGIPHWFLLTALFWFPWIFSTAYLLLVTHPVRGVTQSVIAWWFANNAGFLWLSLVGLGTAFFLVPRLSNRPVYSTYLAAIAFWVLVLFGSWGGIPNYAPVPAWIPSLSTLGTILTAIALIALGLNFRRTCAREGGNPYKGFIAVGLGSFFIAAILRIVFSLEQVSSFTEFTWLVPAAFTLHSYGFFAMLMFAALYFALPQFMGADFWCRRMMRLQFVLSILGLLLTVLPLAAGGILQGISLQNPSIPFLDVAQKMLMFLRVSTLGDLLILAANCAFAVNLISAVVSYYRKQAVLIYGEATADLFGTGVGR
jgi:cytochrome c oxidase cbb3-type subunit 1